MKKVITATVLVAFMGAVAFASLESRNTNTKKEQTKHQKEQKEIKKKKDCRRTCLFS